MPYQGSYTAGTGVECLSAYAVVSQASYTEPVRTITVVTTGGRTVTEYRYKGVSGTANIYKDKSAYESFKDPLDKVNVKDEYQQGVDIITQVETALTTTTFLSGWAEVD